MPSDPEICHCRRRASRPPATHTMATPIASEPVEQISGLEARLERVLRASGLWLAPVAFLVVLLGPAASGWLAAGVSLREFASGVQAGEIGWTFSGLSSQAQCLAAVMAAVVILWVTEALPLPVTALLGAAACVALQVAPKEKVFAPFADPIMFLFIGSFILARAIFLHHLDRRLAFGVLSWRWIGGRPSRILFAFGAVTAFLSAWISNTATTAMMFTIGMSILGFLYDKNRPGAELVSRRYATALMLITSFAASIGGLATPIGTPPNLIGLGLLEKNIGVKITFFQWALIGAPVVVVLYFFMFGYLNYLCPAQVREIAGSREMLAQERTRLGAWTPGQRSTLAAFVITVMLWVVPGLLALIYGNDSLLFRAVDSRVPEAVAALIGAGLLFLLPGDRGGKAMTWKEAVQIDWGVVLLYGGGLAMGVLAKDTGLAAAIGEGLNSTVLGAAASWLPLDKGFVLLVAATLVATLVSEATSNTASANIVIPVAISMAQAAGVDPLEPALGAILGASLGFMLPVSTPCNAIIYGSGFVPISRMVRYGALLDVAGVTAIVLVLRTLLPLVRP